MSTQDYRGRTQEVRRAARAHLAEIRAQRLSRNARAPNSDRAPVVREQALAQAEDPIAFTPSTSAAALAAAAAHAIEPEPASRPLEPVEPPTLAEAAESRSDAALPETSLELLPGAGPGLIWILERSGVHTLQELAACDAGQLRERVGLLGSLVNIDAWIAFARERAPFV